MGLNISKGNMYNFVTHTWNTVKGECYHDCSYCYMKRWGKLNPIRFDEKELKTDLGNNNHIFVGSSCDMWADNVPNEWISKTLNHCNRFDNHYLFQTKNPQNLRGALTPKSSVCITLESNQHYPDLMRNSPTPTQRVEQAMLIKHPLHITIEPVLDFEMRTFVEMIKKCNPVQVNLGADSTKNKLPEPSYEKLLELIDRLKSFTTVHNSRNLKRLGIK